MHNMTSITKRIRPLQTLNNIKMYIAQYFAELDFNVEQHQYKYKDRKLISVSGFIKRYVEPFDADKIAGFVAKKRGVSKQDILQEWEDTKNEACIRGTNIHEFGEYFQERNLKPTNGYEKAIVKFWEDLPEHIIPIFNELQMFSEEKGVAGTADIILFNTKTGKFIIGDYKTNKNLFKNYRKKKLKYDFNFLLDQPYSKYEIQLSFYQLLFEQTGFQVEKRVLIWVKPDGTYEKYFTKDLRENIERTFLKEDENNIEIIKNEKQIEGESW